jgi:hypothetical protein
MTVRAPPPPFVRGARCCADCAPDFAALLADLLLELARAPPFLGDRDADCERLLAARERPLLDEPPLLLRFLELDLRELVR